MKTYCDIKVFLTFILIFIVFPFRTHADTIIVTGNSSAAVEAVGASAGTIFIAESFTTTIAGTIASTSIAINDQDVTGDNNALTEDIYLADGTGMPTGSTLGTSASVPISSLPTTCITKTFSFTPVSVAASTKYDIVIHRTDNSFSSAHYGVVCGQNSSPYPGEEGFSSTINSGYTIPVPGRTVYNAIDVVGSAGGGAATPFSRFVAYWW